MPARTEQGAGLRGDRLAIARALREMAALLEAAGGEGYRARAYVRGARALEHLDDGDLGVLVEQRRLTEVPSIGAGLAAVIAELYETGRSRALDVARQRVPAAVLALRAVPGLGRAKIDALHRQLGIDTVEALEAACEAGRARAVSGIGEKTERRILENIRRMRAARPPRVLLPEAIAEAEFVRAHLRHVEGAETVEIAGDARRWAESVDEISLVVASDRPAETLRDAVRVAPLAAVTAVREAELEGRLATGLAVRVRVAPRAALGAALLEATGPAAHVRRLEARAPAGALPAAASEAMVYAALGLPFIAPELRDDGGEVDAALAGTLAQDLVTEADVQGLVHCHTVYSDGRHTVAQMARAAEALGMAYLTITDHSPAAAYAGGLSVERLTAQWEEIERVQETVSVRLLRGTESDILADGSLDYPDDVLERLDVVIASVHRRHRMSPDQMTDRLVRAMELPCFKIWGHPLGRLVLSRPPVDCRVEEVLDAIARGRAAVEINGDPRRLDLAPEWIRAARQRGIRFVVSTDAHSTADFGNLRYGVAMARRGGVRRDEVLNTLGAEAFARAVRPAGGP